MSSVEKTDTVSCDHFLMDVVSAARDLIGRSIIVTGGSPSSAVIVETEAYAGTDDPASHAAFRPGGRAAAMFARAGTVYVYAAYGMYPCLNIVTGEVGAPAAVLIRGIWPEGWDRPVLGPGRSARFLGVTLDDHGSTITRGRIRVSAGRSEVVVNASPRVGIRRGVELPWRFVDSRAERNPG
jgi:DNA-3-methyladenine glycosylase